MAGPEPSVLRLRQDGLTWNVAGDEVVVLDLAGSVYLKLNGSARVLWERLSAACTREDLVTALTDEFGIEAGRAEADVADFLAELNRRRLLEP